MGQAAVYKKHNTDQEFALFLGILIMVGALCGGFMAAVQAYRSTAASDRQLQSLSLCSKAKIARMLVLKKDELDHAISKGDVYAAERECSYEEDQASDAKKVQDKLAAQRRALGFQ